MKYTLINTLLPLFILTVSAPVFSQELSGRPDKFYTMSGAGFSIPVGESSSFMRPKFSTTLGANFGLGDTGGLFLYPKISLHVFGYDQQIAEDGPQFALQGSRSTTYLLNIALGYRKIVNKFAFYGFVGGGEATNTTQFSNKTNHMGIIEPGAGIEYNIGGANLFIESSYMHGLGKVEKRPFNAVPIAFGIKPNLSRLFK